MKRAKIFLGSPRLRFGRVDDGKWIMAKVANGDSGDFFHLVRGLDGNWRQLTHYSDRISQARFGVDDSLYLLSRQNAPMGKLLRLADPASSIDAAYVVAPESDVAIQSFTPTADLLFVVDMAGGPSQIRMFTTDGKFAGKVPVEGVVSVDGVERIGRDEVLFRTSGYIQPPEWFRYSPATQKANLVAMLSPPFSISFADAEVVRDFAKSKDGTRVPLNIIRLKRGQLDSKNPVLLAGHGGYRISETPGLNPLDRILLDQGFVVVRTNLRGGGEYGEKWHDAGKLRHKQNVFDRLSIIGGSNGGLLMGPSSFSIRNVPCRCVVRRDLRYVARGIPARWWRAFKQWSTRRDQFYCARRAMRAMVSVLRSASRSPNSPTHSPFCLISSGSIKRT
jgi:prolyl oligopeptidase